MPLTPAPIVKTFICRMAGSYCLSVSTPSQLGWLPVTYIKSDIWDVIALSTRIGVVPFLTGGHSSHRVEVRSHDIVVAVVWAAGAVV